MASTGHRFVKTITADSPCERCGSTEKRRNGYLASGEPRLTCAPCRRHAQQASDLRPNHRTKSAIIGPPQYVPGGCRCSDRLGDDPWCLEHEDVPLAG